MKDLSNLSHKPCCFRQAIILSIALLGCLATANSQERNAFGIVETPRRSLSFEEIELQTKVTFHLRKITEKEVREMSDSDPQLREMYIQGMGAATIPQAAPPSYATWIGDDIYRRPISAKILSSILQDVRRTEGVNYLCVWIAHNPTYPGGPAILDEAVRMFRSGKLPADEAAWFLDVIIAIGGPQYESVFDEVELTGQKSRDEINSAKTRFHKRLKQEAVLRSPQSLSDSQLPAAAKLQLTGVSKSQLDQTPTKGTSRKFQMGLLLVVAALIIGGTVFFQRRKSQKTL